MQLGHHLLLCLRLLMLLNIFAGSKRYKNKNMDKRQYEAPATTVVDVKLTGIICQSYESNARAARIDYGAAETAEWE